MAILSRRSLGSIEVLRVSSNPNGVVSSTAKSLAKHTNGSVYECQGGTNWVLLQTYSNVKPAISSSGASEGGSGPQGAQGAIGPQGTQGNPGASGPQGTQGSQGSQGPQGAAGIGPQGLQGSQGSQGSQGPQGGKGSQGAQGSAGSQGASGSSSGGSSLILVASSTAGSTRTNIDFSGLDGDSDRIYVLKHRLVKNNTNSTFSFYPNGSSTGLTIVANGGQASNGTVGASSANSGAYAGSNTYDTWEITMHIWAARPRRMVHFEYTRYSTSTGVTTGTQVYYTYQGYIDWSNTTDNLTSIRLNSSAADGFGEETEAYLYKLQT